MVWVALDRAVRGAEAFNLPAPLERWKALRARVHERVCREGFNEERNSFVQTFGGDALDASLLLLPLVGFLAAGGSADRRDGGSDRAGPDGWRAGAALSHRRDERWPDGG